MHKSLMGSYANTEMCDHDPDHGIEFFFLIINGQLCEY